jgi:predicted Zn finger-like uncharacterized protein
MSLITRCPACQTTFRVVPDQLRMSEGWARCGQCSEIFDAASSLQEDSVLTGSAADVGVNIDRGVDVDLSPSAEIELATDSKTSVESPAQPTRATQNVAAQEAMALRTALQEIVAARQNFSDNVPDDSESKKSPGPAGADRAANATSTINRSQQETSDETAPSFLRELRDSPKRSAWHKTWVRTSLALVSVALSVLLVAQVAVNERDRLATLFPQAKSALEVACSYLNCTVSTLRQIDAVAVESSTFTKIRNDTYRLSLAIKNNAPYELAMPALELTLTDAQDQALIKRVLLGAEVNVNNRLSANSEWTGTIDLSLRSGNGVERVAGYRVLAFYP